MNKQTAHLRALTGLRFIAALLVFIHHCRDFDIHGATVVKYPLGSIGVAFFFVLSGFIMTFVYGSRLTARKIPGYFLTRVARIWPLHVACLLIFLLINLNIGELMASGPERLKLLTNVFLLQSWTFDRDWIVSFNGPSWSLSTEIGFYLVFPLLILIGRRKFFFVYVAIGILTIASLIGVDWLHHNGKLPNWIEVEGVVQSFPLLRLFEFATGMLTAHLFLARRELRSRKTDQVRANKAHSSTKWRATMLEAIALGFAVAVVLSLWSRDLQLLNTLRNISGPAISAYVRFSGALICFAPLILVFAEGKGLFGQLFGSRLFIWLGEISFALYLIHRIVIRWFVRQVWLADYVPAFLIPAMVFVVCIGCAAILYSFIELPCKQAILALFGLKPTPGSANRVADFFKTYFRTASELSIRMPLVVLVIVSGSLVVGSVFIERNERESELEWRLIYQGRRMNPAVADIQFDDQAVLRAVNFRRRRDTLIVRSVWIPSEHIDMDLAVSLQGKKRGRVIERSPNVKAVKIKQDSSAMWVHQAKFPIENIPAGACVVYKFLNSDRSERTNEVRVPIPRNLRSIDK